MGKRLAGMFWALLFLAVPVLGVATFAIAPSINVWLPKDVSEHGASIDSLFYFILALTGVVFVVTEVLLFWFLWKYDEAKQNGAATYIHGQPYARGGLDDHPGRHPAVPGDLPDERLGGREDAAVR